VQSTSPFDAAAVLAADSAAKRGNHPVLKFFWQLALTIYREMMEPHLSTYASNFKLAAYQSVSVHGGVANADPHAMVLMLMDAAAERSDGARCIERGETARQAKLLHSAFISWRN